jgi:hypothetical protein
MYPGRGRKEVGGGYGGRFFGRLSPVALVLAGSGKQTRERFIETVSGCLSAWNCGREQSTKPPGDRRDKTHCSRSDSISR